MAAGELCFVLCGRVIACVKPLTGLDVVNLEIRFLCPHCRFSLSEGVNPFVVVDVVGKRKKFQELPADRALASSP